MGNSTSPMDIQHSYGYTVCRYRVEVGRMTCLRLLGRSRLKQCGLVNSIPSQIDRQNQLSRRNFRPEKSIRIY